MMFTGAAKKRQRVASSDRLSSYGHSTEALAEDPSRIPPLRRISPTATVPEGFDNPATADIVLRLKLQKSPDDADTDSAPKSDASAPRFLDLHLHSSYLRRSRYFDALLSDRWLRPDPSPADTPSRLVLSVLSTPANCSHPFDAHLAVLRLLYNLDFPAAILSVCDALEILPVALELLFDDCIRACVRFLEAVPWTDDEEECVLSLIPFLRAEESRELLIRVRVLPAPGDDESISEEMLYGLIVKAINSHPRVATVKAFVAKLLKDYSRRDSVQRVLDRAFMSSLGTVKELLGEYASPDFRVAGDNDETEAIQRLKLHAATVNTRNLLWLVERLIELRVADTATKEWSDQVALTADLQKTFREDAWRNIAPGFPSLVLKCTGRLASAIADGSILAPRLVRMELVRQWLPVLNVCREIVSPIPCSGHKMLHQGLEETFLQIISTLPISDAQDLLQQCLCFSTRNIDDCPHLVRAFNTWFKRANRPRPDE